MSDIGENHKKGEGVRPLKEWNIDSLRNKPKPTLSTDSGRKESPLKNGARTKEKRPIGPMNKEHVASKAKVEPPSRAPEPQGYHRTDLLSPLQAFESPYPTSSETLESQEVDNPYNSMAIYGIIVGTMAILAYAWYAVDQVRITRAQRAEQHMQQVIASFPKNPYEYNQRQRLSFAKNRWRRFNIRNLSLLGGSAIGTLLLSRWHRMRRVALQRRKTVTFWIATAMAGIVGVGWGAYMFKQSSQPVIIKTFKRNPVLRGFLYIGAMAVVSLIYYSCMLYQRKSHKQKILEAWRKKKWERGMERAQERRDPQMPARPLEMKRPGSLN